MGTPWVFRICLQKEPPDIDCSASRTGNAAFQWSMGKGDSKIGGRWSSNITYINRLHIGFETNCNTLPATVVVFLLQPKLSIQLEHRLKDTVRLRRVVVETLISFFSSLFARYNSSRNTHCNWIVRNIGQYYSVGSNGCVNTNFDCTEYFCAGCQYKHNRLLVVLACRYHISI